MKRFSERKRSLIDYLKNNSPEVLERILSDGQTYFVFQKFGQDWFLVFESNKSLDVIDFENKHKNCILEVLSLKHLK